MKNKYLLLAISFILLSASDYHFNHFNKNLTGEYVLVPPGKINNEEIKAFYISRTEVSNKQYREFLNDLKNKGENEKLKIAVVDTIKWRTATAYNEPYVVHYFQNNTFNDYPVVNISKKGAELYAAWLTEKCNQSSREKVRFSLPSEGQWMLAAKGGSQDAIYGWKGNSLKDEQKGKWHGVNMGNYKIDWQGPRKEIKDNPNADITAPVKSFLPNGYGIYNMSGNVAEMVADKSYTKGGSWHSRSDKLKIDATEDYSFEAMPFIGFRLVMTEEASK